MHSILVTEKNIFPINFLKCMFLSPNNTSKTLVTT